MGKLLIAGAFSYCICSVEIAEGERTEDFYEENNGCVLPVLSGNLSKIGYIHEIKSAISEFKQYGLSVERVGELAEFSKSRGTLYYKLKDLKTLYQAFDAYVAERFITTEDTLALLSRAVHESKIMKNSVVIYRIYADSVPADCRAHGVVAHGDCIGNIGRGRKPLPDHGRAGVILFK